MESMNTQAFYKQQSTITKQGALVDINGYSLAEAWILSNVGTSQGTLQAPPISPDQLSTGFVYFFLLSYYQILLPYYQASTIPPCASDYIFLPSPRKSTPLPHITESSPFMKPCIPPSQKLHLPFWTLSLGTCMPFS